MINNSHTEPTTWVTIKLQTLKLDDEVHALHYDETVIFVVSSYHACLFHMITMNPGLLKGKRTTDVQRLIGSE